MKTFTAVLPEELVLGVDSSVSSCNGHEGCSGDDCNADTGGCPSDGSCGQDC